MKVGVKVLPKKDVLDTQGRAVENTLNELGLKLSGARVGRYIILDIPNENETQALAQAKSMAEQVLANPLIESFELEKL